MSTRETKIYNAGVVLGTWLRPEYADVMLPGTPTMTCSELANAILGMFRTPWQTMDTAPKDGTVIEAVARLPEATAGFPQYIQFVYDDWKTCSYIKPQRVIPWAWRPRTDWPREPREGGQP